MAARKTTKKTLKKASPKGKGARAGAGVGVVTRAIKKVAKKITGRKPRASAAAAARGSLNAARSPVVAAPKSAAGKKKKPATRRAPPARTPRAGAAANSASAARSVQEIGEGAVAPSFALLDQDAQMLSSSSLAGRPYVLYFYPKDDTPGCTKEACDFRDSLARFGSRGIRVIGVSPDPVGSHARFRDKYGLNFTLLSDPDKELANAYGVWVKKQNYGREYMGISRSTFLIDGDGIVRRAWRGVRVPGHIDEVLKEAQDIS